MLSSMLSIHSRLKKLKTHKIFISSFGVICALLLGFMSSTRAVYASSTPDTYYWTSRSITITRNSYYGNGLRITDTLFRLQQSYNYTFYFPNYSRSNYYNGYVTLMLPLTITINNAHMANIQFAGVESNLFQAEVVEYTANSYFTSSDYWNGSVGLYLEVTFPIEGILDNNSYTFNLVVNWDCAYSTNSGGPSPIWSYNWNGYNSDYNLYSTEADLITALDIKNRLGSISSSITTDQSGKSDILESEVASYDTAESLASTSMAGALPSADTQLSQITQYDYGSLYTDNVSAFAFWKSLGDFVLSNSNLVGIGALLILCLFLGLVVYLLRL